MEAKSQPPIEELYRESYRQVLHIGVALFIIPLRWFDYRYAIEFAIFAFFWNLLIMPRWFRGSLRPEEKQKGYSTGMLVYPVSILVMALVFPLPILAAGWAVLSLSDGFATLFGKLLGHTPLPWNKKKTWVGFSSFWASAAIFAWIAILWTGGNTEFSSPFSHRLIGWLSSPCFSFEIPALDAWYEIEFFMTFVFRDVITLFFCSFVAGLGAAIIESLSLPKLNDNVIVPIFFSLFILIFIILSRGCVEYYMGP
jgi:dolichol kinase